MGRTYRIASVLGIPVLVSPTWFLLAALTTWILAVQIFPDWIEDQPRGVYVLMALAPNLIWLFVGVGGLLFRTVQLFFIRDVQTGLVWITKIVTDPFHDIKLYYAAPFHLLRGELIDPMAHKPGA